MWVGVQVANGRRVALEEVEAHGGDSPAQGQDGGHGCPGAIARDEGSANDRGKALALHLVDPAVCAQN